MVKKIITCDHGVRVDRYIRKNVFKNIPQSLLERYLRKKLITVEGNGVDSKTQLNNGERLFIDDCIVFTPKNEHIKTQVKKCNLNYSILYKDEYVIAINKPSGLAVQGGSKISVSINDVLENFERINNELPKIVHRLDKDTSGVLLVARTLETARFLADSFANRRIKKTYRALLVGSLPKITGKIDVKLANKFCNGQNIVCPDDKNGKSAVTYFKLLRIIPKKNLSYVELQPETGRKHQLRVHMKYLGNPIYGDKKYGREVVVGKLSLHAYSVSLSLLNGKVVNISSQLPDYMLDLIDS